MMDRMDEEYGKPYRVQAPLLKKKPRELISARARFGRPARWKKKRCRRC